MNNIHYSSLANNSIEHNNVILNNLNNGLKKGIVINVSSNDVLNVRESNTVSSKILFTLKNNTEVLIKSQKSNGWYEVEYNGKTGFANNRYIKLINDNNASTSTAQYNVTGDINLRKKASWSGEKICIIKKGAILNVVEISNSWAKVLYNNSIAYAPASYLSKIDNNTSTPEVPPTNETPSTPNTETMYYKTSMDLNLRASNSWSSNILLVIKKNTIVEAVSINNDWVKVNFNNKTGFLPLSHLTKYNDDTNNTAPEENPSKLNKIGTVSSTNLNVRTGPGTQYDSISKLYLNDVVEILEMHTNGWYKIESITGVVGWCHGGYLKNIKNGSLAKIENPEEAIQKVINVAKKQLGKPYLWGGNGPDAFDCSGLMVYSYKHGSGIQLPRDSYMQAEFGQAINKSDLKAGDLVFFDTMNKGRVSHVGIYLGDNQMLHAPNKNSTVKIVSINTDYWDSVYITSRRIIPQ